MSARLIAVDSGGTARVTKKFYAVDSGSVTRKIKKAWVIDPSGIARLYFSGNEDDFTIVAGTDGNVHGSGFFSTPAGTFGSATPNVLGDGMAITALFDDNTNHRTLIISGFSTIPVKSYFTTLNCASNPALTSASSTFTAINNGPFGFGGQWQWSIFGVGGVFIPGNSYPGVLIRS